MEGGKRMFRGRDGREEEDVRDHDGREEEDVRDHDGREEEDVRDHDGREEEDVRDRDQDGEGVCDGACGAVSWDRAACRLHE